MITDAEVGAAITVRAAIDAVAEAFAHEAAGRAWNIPKTMARLPHGSAHALGAVDLDADLVLFKTWVRTDDGAASVGQVFSASDGRLQATLETGLLSMLRTGAVTGVATDRLADPSADELTVLGAGRQAFWQVAAVQAVRPLRRVRVWSPTPASREVFAERVRTELGLTATPAATAAEAVAGAPVVVTITRATEPFLEAVDLAPGAVVHAVGAILPHAAEITDDVVTGADLLVVDNVENVRRASRELREHLRADPPTLADVVSGRVHRPEQPSWVLVKAMGTGLCDLALTRLVLAGVAA